MDTDCVYLCIVWKAENKIAKRKNMTCFKLIKGLNCFSCLVHVDSGPETMQLIIWGSFAPLFKYLRNGD